MLIRTRPRGFDRFGLHTGIRERPERTDRKDQIFVTHRFILCNTPCNTPTDILGDLRVLERLQTLETVGISTPILYAFINYHKMKGIGITRCRLKKFAIVTYL